MDQESQDSLTLNIVGAIFSGISLLLTICEIDRISKKNKVN